jgi:hypothetical protein
MRYKQKKGVAHESEHAQESTGCAENKTTALFDLDCFGRRREGNRAHDVLQVARRGEEPARGLQMHQDSLPPNVRR